MESFTMYAIFIVASFVPAIFAVVLLQFYCTFEIGNYLWTFIKRDH